MEMIAAPHNDRLDNLYAIKMKDEKRIGGRMKSRGVEKEVDKMFLTGTQSLLKIGDSLLYSAAAGSTAATSLPAPDDDPEE